MDDCDTCDWFRMEVAAVAIAVSEAPHWAIAVALKAINSTDRAATLTNVMLWIILTILLLPLLPAIFLFIPFLLRDDFVSDKTTSLRLSRSIGGRSDCMHARPATSGAHAAIAAI